MAEESRLRVVTVDDTTIQYNEGMKLIAQLKLQPTPGQADALTRTLEMANAACNAISTTAWNTDTFRQFALHKLVYADSRSSFPLSAQLVVRCISKVADAYKLDHSRQRTFQPHGAISYDDRILSWKLNRRAVSIWTVDGRLDIPFVCGERQWQLLQTRHGETDLAYVNGSFYLLAVCDVEEPEPIDVEGMLGVDLGVTNIAVDSDGTTHSGTAIKNIRYRHRRLRSKLQRKGTHGSRRRKLAGQEARFARYTNHVISKQLVQVAERTKRGIALEDLTHIRSRVRARRSQRPVLHSWSFAQLRAFVAYKAARAGVPVVFVDPRNTSRECSRCGRIDKANRRTQATFLCISCGHAALADMNAAIVVSRRGGVNRPYCPDAPGVQSQGKAVAL